MMGRRIAYFVDNTHQYYSLRYWYIDNL